MSKQHLSQSFPQNLTYIQSRAEINAAIVEEYAAMMRDGVEFDPVEGVQDEAGNIYVWDGAHRGAAATQAGCHLRVNLQPGDRAQAEWLALSANQKHGLRRSRKDKQLVVRRALRHPNGVSLCDRQIARHCGVSDKTVAKIRRQMEASSEIPKIDTRLVQRNGVTYEQNTQNIGAVQRGSQDTEPQSTPTLSQQRTDDSNRDLISTSNGGGYKPANRSFDNQDHSTYPPTPQEFECPCCGQDRVVGINGSQRWCLHCGAEWGTAAEFLAEVTAIRAQQAPASPTRHELQRRFQTIVAGVEEQQLDHLADWLDGLEGQHPEKLGGDGDGLAIAGGGRTTRFRAAWPQARDYDSLPRTERIRRPPALDQLAGDRAIERWQIDPDRLAYALVMRSSASAIRAQFGGGTNQAMRVRDYSRLLKQRLRYWRRERAR